MSAHDTGLNDSRKRKGKEDSLIQATFPNPEGQESRRSGVSLSARLGPLELAGHGRPWWVGLWKYAFN